MKVQTPAKLNLFLEIGNKLPDGFHQILSLVEPINLCDTLEFYPSKDVKVEFVSSSEIPLFNNSVTKSVFLLKNKYKVSKGIRIRVIKRIPVGSGLGGGSSDAACTLKMLNKIWKLNLTNVQIKKIASSIGSDVPLFISHRRCVIEGTGEKVKLFFRSPVFWYVLAIPDFSVSTKKVYDCYDKWNNKGDLTEGNQNIKMLLSATIKGDIRRMEELMFNRLRCVSERLYREIKEVRLFLEEKSGKKFFLSGSGGTLFSIFREKEGAENIVHSFQYPDWRGIVAKSFWQY